MRLRDVRLAILKGLAGILHSTADALLRQAQAGEGIPEVKPPAPGSSGGPPQHWLERVKDVRVWYGTTPAGKAPPRTASSRRRASLTARPGEIRKTPHLPQQQQSVSAQPNESEHADTTGQQAGGQPPQAIHSPQAGRPAGNLPQETSRRTAVSPGEGEEPALTSLNPPSGPPGEEQSAAKRRFRLRLPTASGLNRTVPWVSGETVEPGSDLSVENQSQRTAAAKTGQEKAVPVFEKVPETDSIPPVPISLREGRTKAPVWDKNPSSSLHEPQALRIEKVTMQVETTETTIDDLSEAPCEPAPMTEGQPLQPRMVVYKAPAQARRNWPGLVQHEESPCPAAPPDREPLAGMPQAETLVHSSMAASTGTVSQAGMDFSASVEGRWLELPPDPTYERSIEAEREAWAEEMRERQHEQKLANEQRGDLWSA